MRIALKLVLEKIAETKILLEEGRRQLAEYEQKKDANDWKLIIDVSKRFNRNKEIFIIELEKEVVWLKEIIDSKQKPVSF